MIKLEIEEYCDNCPDFESDISKDSTIAYDPLEFIPKSTEINCTIIRCANREKCASIASRLKQALK